MEGAVRCTGRAVRRRELTGSYLRAGAPRTHRRHDRGTRTIGHLGRALISKLLTDVPNERVIEYSRDEKKQKELAARVSDNRVVWVR